MSDWDDRRNRLARRLATLALRLDAFVESPRAPLLKVVGTFRSGTNLTRHLLEEHFRCRIVFSKWGWKHGVPQTNVLRHYELRPPTPILLVSRDPVVINASFYTFWRRTRPDLLAGADFATFIRSRFVAHDNSVPDTPRYLFATPTDYWNHFHYAYFTWGAVQSRLHHLRYEDLTADPEAALGGLAERLGLARRSAAGNLRLPTERTAPSADFRATRLEQRRDETAPEISKEDRAFIWSRVDDDVLAMLERSRPETDAPASVA